MSLFRCFSCGRNEEAPPNAYPLGWTVRLRPPSFPEGTVLLLCSASCVSEMVRRLSTDQIVLRGAQEGLGAVREERPRVIFIETRDVEEDEVYLTEDGTIIEKIEDALGSVQSFARAVEAAFYRPRPIVAKLAERAEKRKAMYAKRREKNAKRKAKKK